MTRTITLNINGEIFKLEIDAEEEEIYRAATQQLMGVIGDYSSKYVSASYSKILAMVALDMSVNLVKSEQSLKEAEEHISEIEEALGCDDNSSKDNSVDLLSY